MIALENYVRSSKRLPNGKRQISIRNLFFVPVKFSRKKERDDVLMNDFNCVKNQNVMETIRLETYYSIVYVQYIRAIHVYIYI